jgi:hypothetical protein
MSCPTKLRVHCLEVVEWMRKERNLIMVLCLVVSIMYGFVSQ